MREFTKSWGDLVCQRQKRLNTKRVINKLAMLLWCLAGSGEIMPARENPMVARWHVSRSHATVNGADGHVQHTVREDEPHDGLACIIHEGSSRTRADAKRNGHSEA